MSDSRFPTTIDINQLISWNASCELVLKPIYQRNKVWNDASKSYLIDSIMRNYPIPPIFMRDKLNLTERKTIREVVDGQQRISTMLDFYNNKFPIKKSQNKELGGKYFCDFSEEEQERFLTYKIIVEKITEKDDSLVFDMFARLNSNNIPLNKQELRNAMFTGEFKVAAYDMSLSYRDMFTKFGIFTTSQLSRMLDVEFISILMLEYDLGIMDITSKTIDKYYQSNNENYPCKNEVFDFMYCILDKLNNIFKMILTTKYRLPLLQLVLIQKCPKKKQQQILMLDSLVSLLRKSKIQQKNFIWAKCLTLLKKNQSKKRKWNIMSVRNLLTR